MRAVDQDRRAWLDFLDFTRVITQPFYRDAQMIRIGSAGERERMGLPPTFVVQKTEEEKLPGLTPGL